jgi:hypothetical protein
MSRFNAALSVCHGVAPVGFQSFRSIISAMISRVDNAVVEFRNTTAVASRSDEGASGSRTTAFAGFLVVDFAGGGTARERRFGIVASATV